MNFKCCIETCTNGFPFVITFCFAKHPSSMINIFSLSYKHWYRKTFKLHNKFILCGLKFICKLKHILIMHIDFKIPWEFLNTSGRPLGFFEYALKYKYYYIELDCELILCKLRFLCKSKHISIYANWLQNFLLQSSLKEHYHVHHLNCQNMRLLN
jgi:hypothetical protein